MILFEGVSFRYPGAQQDALQDIDLRIGTGECVLVAGDSGCGKSTLLYAINGLIPHLFPGDLRGRVLVEGVEPGDVPLQQLSQRVGTVFQNPENQLFMLTVADDVAFGCENLCLPSGEIRTRVDAALRQVGLVGLRERPIFTLSGGQKQRCAMAGVLAMAPGILVLDEPTADLDGEGTEEVFAQLTRLRQEGKTIVLVEHKLEEAALLADRIVVMEGGRIAADGPPRRIFAAGGAFLDNLDLPDVVRLGIEPTPLTAAEACVFIEARGGTGSHPVSGEIDRPPQAPDSPPMAEVRNQHDSPPMVEVRDLHFAYDGGEEVLKGVSFALHGGEMVAVIGANGSGKTTLFRLLMGLVRPASGEVEVDGILAPQLSDLIGRVGFLFQNPDEQLFCDTVRQEIAFGPAQVGVRADLDAYLEMASLTYCAGRHPHTLSRGERQRLALVSLLAMETGLLLLDEPTTGLDRRNWQHALQIARNLARRGKTVIFSTHNMKVVGQFADRVLLFSAGRLVADGLPRQVLVGDLDRYGLRIPQIVDLSRQLGTVCLTCRELMAHLQRRVLAC